MAAVADLTFKFRVTNEAVFREFLGAVGDLVECATEDLERMDVGPRSRIKARLDRLRAATPALAESIGLEDA